MSRAKRQSTIAWSARGLGRPVTATELETRENRTNGQRDTSNRYTYCNSTDGLTITVSNSFDFEDTTLTRDLVVLAKEALQEKKNFTRVALTTPSRKARNVGEYDRRVREKIRDRLRLEASRA